MEGDAGWTILIGGFLIFTGIFVCPVIVCYALLVHSNHYIRKVSITDT